MRTLDLLGNRPKASRATRCPCTRSTFVSFPRTANTVCNPSVCHWRLIVEVPCCGVCAGYVCPTGARVRQPICWIWPRREVIPFRSKPELRSSGWSRNLAQGRPQSTSSTEPPAFATSTAHGVMPWRPAHGSVLLLLRSGFQSPQIGRNYMLHLCSIVVGVYPQQCDADSSFSNRWDFPTSISARRSTRTKWASSSHWRCPGHS